MSDPRQNSSELPSKPPIWNDPKYRAMFFQILLISALAYFFYSIIQNTLDNMTARGVSTGFGFMSEPAGFDILQTLIPFDSTYSFGRSFLVGILNTLLVTALGIVFATLLGFIIGIARLSNNWLISKIANVYIETFRNIPLLIQIIFWYSLIVGSLPAVRDSFSLFDSFFLNQRGINIPSPIYESGFIYTAIALIVGIIGSFILRIWAKRRQAATGKQFPIFFSILGLIILLPMLVYFITGSPITWDVPKLGRFNLQGGATVIPELVGLLIALTIYTAAFIAEIVRSGIKAVSHGQSEAALSVGLTPGQNLKLVVIPQALRVIIPPLTSQYLNLFKNSSLAAAIGYPDLVAVFMGTTLNQTGQAVEIVAITMAVYLTVSLLISMFMNWYNAKMSLVER
ncbi:MAG TPA: amino acid ABC transporter permease [Leucothrix sp.]|nr:amino acid ABC transporter permease [Leucothrix sp.]